MAILAAACYVGPISDSPKNGHVTLCPSIAICSLLGKHTLTYAFVSPLGFVAPPIAGKPCTIVI